jgi:hypothetical protein
MIRLAYHANPRMKEEFLQRVRAHAAANEIVRDQGIFWKNGKGSAIGCTIHSCDCEMYETITGIPVELACIAEGLFRSMAPDGAASFPTRFLEVIAPGAMLALVGSSFLRWLLTEELVACDHPRVAAAMNEITPLPSHFVPDFSDRMAAARRLSKCRDAYPDRLPGRVSCALGAVYGLAQVIGQEPWWMYGACVAVASAAAAAGWTAEDDDAEEPDLARQTDAAGRMADKLIRLLKEAPVPGPPYIDT